jgi:hypothetical protein
VPFAQAGAPAWDADGEGEVTGAVLVPVLVPVPVAVADEGGVPGEPDDEVDDEQAASAASAASEISAAATRPHVALWWFMLAPNDDGLLVADAYRRDRTARSLTPRRVISHHTLMWFSRPR